MTRSRRRTPRRGVASNSDKPFKLVEHRRERRAVRIALWIGEEPLPHPKKYGNPWSAPKDGKRWFNPAKWPKGMRK